jgi:predicted ribosomally synthesized peptide with nif11-like leader
MTIEKLRKLASIDSGLAVKLNSAHTFERLAHIADEAGIDIKQDDFETQNEELSEEELSEVSGGMRSLGGFGMKKFMSDEPHICDSIGGCSCDNCEPHSCDTADGNTCCSNCGGKTGTSLRFF